MRTPTTLLLLAGFLLISQFLAAQTFNEILGRPTDVSVTISILFEQSAEVFWEYGTQPGDYLQHTDTTIAASGVPAEVDFTGLQPDMKYYYRTRYRPAGSSSAFLAGAEHTFHTQRGGGSTFTFTIEADEHLYDKKGYRPLYQVCLDNQAKDHPDFMLSMGDIFGDDHHPFAITSAEMEALHKTYRPFLGTICHSVPFFVCLGNHEGENDFYLAQTPPENIAHYATTWRKLYYPNPYPNEFYTGNTEVEPFGVGNPENYYAWTWGEALFVVLDAYRDQCDTSAKPKNWDWSLGLTQYNWLKNTLETSTARYKFVFAHHTRGEGRGGVLTARYYEWGGYEGNGTTWGFTENRPGWAKPIHQLFADNGVNIFFQGHDHLFAREVLDGVIYQEVPMPSDSSYQLGMLANADAYVSDTIGGSGHLRVMVSPSCTRVDFVRAYLPKDTLGGVHHNGEVAFSYTLGTCQSGIVEAPEHLRVRIYPNPARDQVTVALSQENKHDLQVSLINIMGQILLQSTSAAIGISSIPAGIYFLHITAGGEQANKKFIITR